MTSAVPLALLAAASLASHHVSACDLPAVAIAEFELGGGKRENTVVTSGPATH